MQSNNPVFARSDGFNGRSSARAPQQTGYTDPSTWQIAQGGAGRTSYDTYAQQTGGDAERMSVETVVHKTAITLGLVVASALVAWFMIGDLIVDGEVSSSAVGLASSLAGIGAIVGLGLALVNSFKKVVSPGLVMAYAVVEGLFVGAISKLFVLMAGTFAIVPQAVLGTMMAFGGTLFVYRVFNIKVTDKFRKGMIAVLFGFLGLLVANLVLSLFGLDLGLRGNGPLGIIIGVVAVVLGVLCLVLDFDFVERGVAAGLPERESWRAAFGLTVTLIWLYVEILRLLAIFSSD